MYGTTVSSITATKKLVGYPSGQGIFPSAQEEKVDFSLSTIPTVPAYKK
jgi:hypothetical protein